VSGLDAGNYTLTVTTIPDANHNPVTVNATITVNRLKTDLTASEITTTYNINKDLVITLKDANGNTLAGFNVTVDLNGVKTYTTDSKGQVKVSTKGLAPNTYTAKISFNGDANHVNSAADVKVTVNKATPKLTAKAKTFKSSVKTKKYTIVLKDNTGKAIKKAKVTLKVKGKTYKATTNSKGKATFKITKLAKKGTYKATITFKGDKNYKKVTKKAKIKVIITFKTVSKGSKDKSTVKQIQQALKDNGYYITYKGHYLKIDGIYKGCTERSVKQFQKAKHLKVTGKVDEKTAKKLGII
jgi:peptidoglycan hydrolase-like protein with peptidoglycan-binding domain